MKTIHYYLIIFSLFCILFVVTIHLKNKNYYHVQHENCMKYNDYFYTKENCQLCDSLIKTQYYAEN